MPHESPAPYRRAKRNPSSRAALAPGLLLEGVLPVALCACPASPPPDAPGLLLERSTVAASAVPPEGADAGRRSACVVAPTHRLTESNERLAGLWFEPEERSLLWVLQDASGLRWMRASSLDARPQLLARTPLRGAASVRAYLGWDGAPVLSYLLGGRPRAASFRRGELVPLPLVERGPWESQEYAAPLEAEPVTELGARHLAVLSVRNHAGYYYANSWLLELFDLSTSERLALTASENQSLVPSSGTYVDRSLHLATGNGRQRGGAPSLLALLGSRVTTNRDLVSGQGSANQAASAAPEAGYLLTSSGPLLFVAWAQRARGRSEPTLVVEETSADGSARRAGLSVPLEVQHLRSAVALGSRWWLLADLPEGAASPAMLLQFQQGISPASPLAGAPLAVPFRGAHLAVRGGAEALLWSPEGWAAGISCDGG